MRIIPRLAIGVIGQIVAILLLALLIEYGATTLLYERASQFSIRDDEANRLAEHLALARKVMNDGAVSERSEEAAELTTNRYALSWRASLPSPPAVSPTLVRMRTQIMAWEPALAGTDLRLRMSSPGREGHVVGGLRLNDGSWLYFQMLDPLHELTFGFERLMLALTPAVALMLIGGLLVRRTLQPLRSLASAAEGIGHGEAIERSDMRHVPEQGPGEVRRVIGAFNEMQERIHKLIDNRTEALAAVGHDFRTPLARLHLRADGVDDEELRESIHRDVTEMDDMVASLLAYLGGESSSESASATDLAVMCQTVVENAEDQGRDATYAGPEHLEMRLKVVGVRRAIVNLVENALHYGGNARVALIEEDGFVTVRVDDDGPGIPEHARLKVLEPFVRLDGARSRDTSGFGLGLPIVVRAAEGEGGNLSLTNRPEGGLRAELRLPRR